jgi:exodeoxyribonuclease V gamma subunit
MGLHLVSSNRIESLLSELARRLLLSPLSSPFSAEVIIVPSPAMARWINLQLARQHRVAANIEYPLPASWIWGLTGSLLKDAPEQDPLERSAASWKIHALLPQLLESPPFLALKNYLQDGGDDLKRWQLSTRIADLFDRYQFYRPELIRDWSQGKGDDWQAMLWRMLIRDHPRTHRVAVLDRLLQTLSKENPGNTPPQRISLFAISSLPPLFIDLLHALAAHTHIDLYLHSPTDQYWADLKSKRALSRLRLTRPDEAAYHDTGNELLASWGRQGQAFQDLLLAGDGLHSSDWEEYRQPGSSSLLNRIQQDIFTLDETTRRAAKDDSVQIHICHSPLRECQVLHDQLLTLLARDSSIKPEDILVMIPEISRYAPYIEAVFRRDETGARPFIPWNLSDITIADEHPLIRIFFQLLELPHSRFTVSEVLSYLDVPELTARFGLDREACEEIRLLLDESNVRWGLDGEQKQGFGLPPLIENTWKQAEQRLFSGYALGEVGFWEGIAPLPGVEGGRARSLGRFWLLFDRLRAYRQRLARPHRADTWQRLLNRLLDDFFSDRADDDGKLQQIRDALDALQQQAGGEPLSPELLRHWLNGELGSQAIRGRYFSGGISFCGMRPMRSLPFRVICLLGMNDLAFPRRERPLEFDRMAGKWRPGDPRKGDEDRYLLLETLLCARQTFYISYSGRDMKDNSERQPSVLVRELLDFIESRYDLSASDAPLTRIHPLQPFSPRNYAPTPSSFDAYWCQVAEAIRQPRPAQALEPWPDWEITPPEAESREIELSRLQRFIRHPVRFFFNTRLQIWLGDGPVAEDDEPFRLDGLSQWRLKQTMAGNFLQQHATRQEQLQAQGLLPHGIFSTITFDQSIRDVQPLIEQLQPYAGITPRPRLVDIRFEPGFRLSGQVGRFLPGRGLLHYTPSRFKGGALLELWLEHLALCSCNRLADKEESVLICSDLSWRFPRMPADAAHTLLQCYLEHYWQGLRRPLPLFPESSYAWAVAAEEPDRAMRGARSKWQGNPYQGQPGEMDDPYIQLAMRGGAATPLDHPEFAALACGFYQALLALRESL